MTEVAPSNEDSSSSSSYCVAAAPLVGFTASTTNLVAFFNNDLISLLDSSNK